MTDDFTLQDLRNTIGQLDNPPALVVLVNDLENAVRNGENTAFDYSKAIIESICKTILNSRAIDNAETWDFPELFREVRRVLPIIEGSYPKSTDNRASIQRAMGSFGTLIQSLSELRNNNGWASHGPDGFMESMGIVQIRFVARSAESLACFLLNAHQQYPNVPIQGRFRYKDFQDFNEFVDENYNLVEIFGIPFLPSQILFNGDEDGLTYREAYEQYLIDKEEMEKFAGEEDSNESN